MSMVRWSVLALLIVPACSSPPPRPSLRFQPAGPTAMTAGANGLYVTRVHDVDVTVDLGRAQTRIQVTAENRTGKTATLQVGPDAGQPRLPIGELLLRPLASTNSSGPAIVPYLGMTPVNLEDGWRATFYIDEPLGREPALGQYFVLSVEARVGEGPKERRTMPLIAGTSGGGGGADTNSSGAGASGAGASGAGAAVSGGAGGNSAAPGNGR
jgi:hypothetical protein